MADSPKCPECKGQTYKVAAKPEFRCHDCGKCWHKSMFEEK